ncbi:MAG: 7-cyano-7-deazaguanine synthase QueC [Candidatus Heimdallarchaeota archaeon]|nr:7-cyano-7-deazaguanine synthase QueC [Candidatus Heimdallarchaeota archaeon]
MSKKVKTAIILLSGGLDSTVCLWWAKNQLYSRVDCITFEYGSKEEIVLKSVTKRLGELALVDGHEFISLNFLAKFSKKINSSLITGSTKGLPKLTEEELDNIPIGLESAKSVWIPGRNLLFLSIASAFAETIGGDVDIITGFNLEEGTTFPDNTQEFIDDFIRTAARGILHAKINVLSPLVGMNKTEIVNLGNTLQIPFQFSNSCYDPKGFDSDGHPVHCGICESCLRRKRGFAQSSLKDPTIYSKK